MKKLYWLAVLAGLAGGPAQPAVRIKELVTLEGARENQLIGYGLVVGLNGTGDKRQTVFSAQSLANMLERMGVTVAPAALLVRNTAAVMVAATLPPFAQPGARIDVTVAAIGDATNLQGGLLLICPLKGADGQVYAVAQGSVVTGGFAAARGGASQTVNHPTAGRIPSGGIVEKSPPSPFGGGAVRLQLQRADFTTAARVAERINRRFGGDSPPARAENAALVSVNVPPGYGSRLVEFLAEIEALEIEMDRRQRVVINERTGSIVMGKDVRIAPVSILHGALSVEILSEPRVSQPAPLSAGQTQTTVKTEVEAKEERARSVQIKPGATVEDLVRGLVGIGSTPRDIIAILQALRAANALDADLEVI
jgi:flagellar P-ring protein precursor FlgI